MVAVVAVVTAAAIRRVTQLPHTVAEMRTPATIVPRVAAVTHRGRAIRIQALPRAIQTTDTARDSHSRTLVSHSTSRVGTEARTGEVAVAGRQFVHSAKEAPGTPRTRQPSGTRLQQQEG